MTVDSAHSINRIQSLKHLREGLAIYKTGRSPYWQIRLRDPYGKKYITRSSKETSRVEAIAGAHEYAASYFRNLDRDLAVSKFQSFEFYAQLMLGQQTSDTKWPDSDKKLLYRKGDGLLNHFGPYDVAKITSRMVREYLVGLDNTRQKPLAESTKAKHVIIIRKVLALAVEDGLIANVPVLPKQKTVDRPRHAFNDESYRRFMKAAESCIEGNEAVRGVQIRIHHLRMFKFIVHGFLRPTVGELFGIKHKDMTIHGNPHHLKMEIYGGKTGRRTSVTMPLGVLLYRGELNVVKTRVNYEQDFVWMPEYPNRTTAINTARRIFNHIIEKADLVDDDIKLSPYSLRHYALQRRLLGSKGKVNIYTLAKNAGTSVDQLERFYLKSLQPSKEMIENLHA